MAELPRISVIIPVRNSVTMLERALQSVFDQEYPNLELIVLDAASTDGTQDVIERHKERITFSRSEADNGPNDAYNQGIALATGDIIALLNADDWYEAGILRAAGQAFLDEPELEVVSAEARVVEDAQGEILAERERFTDRLLDLNPAIGAPIPNARFFRRGIFKRHGKFEVFREDGKRMIGSDVEFLLRISRQRPRHKILPQLGYTYFAHGASSTFSGNVGPWRQMVEERVDFAEQYLHAHEFSPEVKRELKRWHRRGTARAFWWRLMSGQPVQALRFAGRGLRISPLRWLPEWFRVGIAGRWRGAGRSRR